MGCGSRSLLYRHFDTSILTYLLHGAESFLRSELVLQLVKKFPAFLEPEGSSPYSQVPATCPYPEPTPSSPHNPLPFNIRPICCPETLGSRHPLTQRYVPEKRTPQTWTSFKAYNCIIFLDEFKTTKSVN